MKYLEKKIYFLFLFGVQMVILIIKRKLKFVMNIFYHIV